MKIADGRQDIELEEAEDERVEPTTQPSGQDKRSRSQLADFGVGIAVVIAFGILGVLAGSLLSQAVPEGEFSVFVVDMLAIGVGGFLATPTQRHQPVLRGTLLVLIGTTAYVSMLVVFDGVVTGISAAGVVSASPVYVLMGIAGVGIARAVFNKRWI